MIKINYNTNSLTNISILNIELNLDHEKELVNKIISLINLLIYSEKKKYIVKLYFSFKKNIIFGHQFNSSFVLPNSVNKIIFGDDLNLKLLNLSSS